MGGVWKTLPLLRSGGRSRGRVWGPTHENSEVRRNGCGEPGPLPSSPTPRSSYPHPSLKKEPTSRGDDTVRVDQLLKARDVVRRLLYFDKLRSGWKKRKDDPV